MLAQFDNNLQASFYLWAENRLGNQAQAYITVSGAPLYYIRDPALPPGYNRYSSSFKQWVCDSGVSGAVIAQTVSGAGFSAPLDRSSGIIFDYDNGGVLVPASYGTSIQLTATYSFKEVNVYQPNEDEEYILTQGKYYLNPRFNGQATGAVPPYVEATPAIFINTLHSDNVAWALGGLNDTPTTMSMVVIAESNYQLNAVLSLFRDARYRYIPLLSAGASFQDPINQQGDTKSGYNYNQYIALYGTPGNLIYIEQVKTSKVNDKIKMNPLYFVGLIDMTLSYMRVTS